MTVAGQRNHYNVKLLKGYGVSINLKDNRICLKGGRDPFTGEQESEEWFVTQIPYERIVISGKSIEESESRKEDYYYDERSESLFIGVYQCLKKLTPQRLRQARTMAYLLLNCQRQQMDTFHQESTGSVTRMRQPLALMRRELALSRD
jgi:hypothetical protein